MAFHKGQLEQIWIIAGGKASAAPLAAAIALAESAGDPNSVNHNTNGTVDRGLWQINSIHGSQSTFSIEDNARAAVAISNNGTNWKPWVTYNTGAYKKFYSDSSDKLGIVHLGESLLDSAKSEVNNVVGAVKAVPKGIEAIGSGINSIASVIDFISSPGGIARMLKVVGGGVLILIAGNELVKVGGEGPVTGSVGRAAGTTKKIVEVIPK